MFVCKDAFLPSIAGAFNDDDDDEEVAVVAPPVDVVDCDLVTEILGASLDAADAGSRLRARPAVKAAEKVAGLGDDASAVMGVATVACCADD